MPDILFFYMSMKMAIYLSQNFADFLGKVHTNQGNLNIRSEPNSSASIVGSYKKGELVEILGNTSTHWYKTKKGYVYGEYIVPARGKVYNCVALNIRKEPKVEEIFGPIIKKYLCP